MSSCMFIVVIIELKDTTYSVVEDDRIFNITVVKQGDPGRAIVVRIVASDNTTDSKCMTMYVRELHMANSTSI